MGPYTRIEGAEKLLISDTESVTSPSLYLLFHSSQIAQRKCVQRWTCLEQTTGFIEHGRWVAKCLNCKTMMLTRPDWELACCGECGGIFHGVEFPKDYQKIESALLQRPIRENQNCLPGETFDDILRENELHGQEIQSFNGLIGGYL